MNDAEHLRELDESARRAGYLVAEHIDAIVELAEREAETIRREAEREAEAVRQGAQRDADAVRRYAADFAEQLLDHVHSLGLPLKESVKGMRPGSEEPGSAAVGKPGEERVPAEPRSREEEEVRDLPPLEAVDVDPDLLAFTPGLVGAPPEQEARLGRRLRHLKSKISQGGSRPSAVFITAEGHCAVCDRTFAAGSESSLAQSSWKVNGDVGLCPECQAERWELPEGTSLPFRRSES